MSDAGEARSGGYEDGYSACPCFWGERPGSLIGILLEYVGEVAGLRVLDAGAGEGKNAVFLAERGAEVLAIDISPTAVTNGRRYFGERDRLEWMVGDVRSMPLKRAEFDIVIAYGLAHCLASAAAITAVVSRLKRATADGGYHVLCAFNARQQDLGAHPGFRPTLLPHRAYEELYADWTLRTCTDEDLCESHPHNGIQHSHSMTRIIARAPNGP